MTWNFHRYYNDSSDGLIAKLKLSESRITELKNLRSQIRGRTKKVFEEAKELVLTSSQTESLERFKARLSSTNLKYLSNEDQVEIAILLRDMEDEARNSFLNLTPRFWTQGSFQYDTLNNPYITPPQEMDIDDGTYLPMEVFKGQPVIGHRLLILLVDSSLKSLEKENVGWQFDSSKPTCARLKIPTKNTHIDVPMYAIPKEQFLLKEKHIAIAKSRGLGMETMDSINSQIIFNHEDYRLDENCVNLALREGEKKWVKSDPQIIEDWFNESCDRIGPDLRKICRFLKAWRDAQWQEGGGPSSISLMAATVSIFDRVQLNKGDLGASMISLAENLPEEFSKGVESPDHTDEKPLFPNHHEHSEYEREVIKRLKELQDTLMEAQASSTKALALSSINRAFGQRVIKSELIVSEVSAPAFSAEPTHGAQAATINPTMASG